MWKKLNLDKRKEQPKAESQPTVTTTMRNPYEVLRSKEREMEKLKLEIQALRIAAPLLCSEETANEDVLNASPGTAATPPKPDNASAASAGANGGLPSGTVSRWP